MNLKIRDFQQKLINFINSVELDIEIKRLVLAGILSQIETASNMAINNEISKIKETENKNETDKEGA